MVALDSKNVVQENSKTWTPKIYTLGIIFLVVIIGASLLRHQSLKKTNELSDLLIQENPSYKIYPDDHIKGNKDTALVTVINYSDTECPSCIPRHFDLKKLVERYGNDIAVVSRYSPPPIHKFKNSLTEAKALECSAVLVGEDAYDKYSDAIYNNTEGNDSLSYETLIKLGEELGLKKESLESCIAHNEKVAEKIKRDMTAGTLSGLTMVPSAVILNTRNKNPILVEGNSYVRLTRFIDAILNK